MRAPTKKQTVIILVCVLLLGALAFYLASPKEPSYQGKTLTQWLKDYSSIPTAFHLGYDPKREPEREMAERAIRAFGTNSIPTLLRMLDARDFPGAVQTKSFFRQYGFNVQVTLADEKGYLALSGFALLDTNGAAAIPELTRYIMTHDGRSTLHALHCLDIVENGSDYSTASRLQLLLKLFRDADDETAYRGATLLAGYHPDAAKNAGVYKRFPQLAPPTANDSSTNPPVTNK